MLLVAIPDPMGTRQIVDYARRINPHMEIIVRTHSEEEWERLRDGQISGVVLGERELAITMAGYALRRFGVSTLEVQAILQGLRGQS